MSEAAAMAVIVASIAGCVASTNYFHDKRDETKTAQQVCVEKAWTQADRIECLKAGVKP